MVYMAMCSQQSGGLQLVVGDILFEGLFIFIEKHATINDYAFFCFVGYNIAVFLQHVAHNMMNIQHCSKLFCLIYMVCAAGF